jgi:hypothetical protein
MNVFCGSGVPPEVLEERIPYSPLKPYLLHTKRRKNFADAQIYTGR